MTPITKEQQQDLIELIHEQFGSTLSRDDFTDAVLGLFEDSPGFETITQSQAKSMINQLWRIYCVQSQQEA